MARFPLNVADRSRYAWLADAGLMPVALRVPRMSTRERVRFVCSTAARGLLPELVRIATESAAADARAAGALAEEDPGASSTFRDEADFWSAFGARHPDPRGRWRERGDQGLARRSSASRPRTGKAPVISPPEVEASPPAPEAGTISTTVVVVPLAKASADPKSNEARTPERTGRTRRRRSRGSFVNVEQAPRDLPAWAQDILEMLPPLVARAAAAKVLDLSQKSLDRRIAEKALVAVRPGRRVLIPRLALVSYLVAQSR